MFKKDDPTDRSNYRPISLLSVPSKILESCVSDTILQHVVDNGLLRASLHDPGLLFTQGRVTAESAKN